MDIQTILSIAQIVLGIFVIASILLQQRGAGMGGAFGGGDGANVYATRRGAERIIFYATIVASVLFFGIAIAMNIL
jgi:protein translocase SecG subunit